MKKFTLNTLALVCATVLTGCGDSETNIVELPPTIIEDTDDHSEEVGKGRLAIAAADQAVVHIFNLEDNNLVESITLTNPAEYLYASPENRYAVAVQRSFDTVEFVDGGVWQELHGDHYDQHNDDPVLSNFALFDVKPTHYVPRGDQTVVFFDGNKDTGVNASLSILTDDSISAEQTVANHDFDTYLHGTAEIRGDYVLTTLRDSDSESSLPESIAILELHNDHFHQEQILETTCPALHGSFQNETHIAFGCSDGVLAIEQQGNVFSEYKISNPTSFAEGVRIGSLTGSAESNIMIGTASSEFYLIDLAAQDITQYNWQAEDDLTSVTYGFDGHNEHLLILDSKGYLNVFPAEDNWQLEERFQVFDNLAVDATPSIVASKADDLIYIINEQQVTAVDLHEGEVVNSFELNFTPGNAAWLGIAVEEEHEH
ncbi:hypothetical protein L3081_04305 [Colwellia sp. MSW7]|uniref:5-methyltetrahydrofolate--homocysteine methyltransferase n=1 Tax=Colwellia maritima TaxID=2912588 RepID=A0ABS9WXQ0_9GAMM|nr:hypothetical protein [Colwellia maritima]MCI2282770.1 hypothetical protein [Colwellia maritima]